MFSYANDSARALLRGLRHEHILKGAVPWQLDVPYQRILCFQGHTYKPEPLFHGVKTGPNDHTNPGIRHGSWGYRHCTLPRGDWLYTWHAGRRGLVCFDADVTIPMIYQNMPSNIWMSITPAEMLSQRRAIQFAKGNVVLVGLGMGWLLDRICAKKIVNNVVVVEKSQELMDWYGYRICREQPKVEKVLVNNVYDVLEQFDPTKYKFIFDIWIGYGDAYHDVEYQNFKEQPHVRTWAWGDVRTYA
jgi:hypothetical protein